MTAFFAFGCGGSGSSGTNGSTEPPGSGGAAGGSTSQGGDAGGSSSTPQAGSSGTSAAGGTSTPSGGTSSVSSSQAGKGGSGSAGSSSTSKGGAGGSATIPDVGPSNDVSKGWGNVRFDGGGFVDGIVASTKEPGLLYARTDVGGVYRWNSKQKVWVPLMDAISQEDVGLYGVESIAIDDKNPGRLYVLAGTSYFSKGKTVILRSQDYGATFETVDVSAQWRAHGNGLGRQTGEKLAVDPNNSNIVLCGSRAAGLFKSNDAGKTWTALSDVSAKSGGDLMSTNGIAFVLFDPTSKLTADGGTSTIYMGVSDTKYGLMVSKNGGSTFDTIAGGPTNLMPNRAVLNNGTLYITYANSLGPYGLSNGAPLPLRHCQRHLDQPDPQDRRRQRPHGQRWARLGARLRRGQRRRRGSQPHLAFHPQFLRRPEPLRRRQRSLGRPHLPEHRWRRHLDDDFRQERHHRRVDRQCVGPTATPGSAAWPSTGPATSSSIPSTAKKPG